MEWQTIYRTVDSKGVVIEVRSTPYGKSKLWEGYVNGEKQPLAFWRRLKDAKEWAEKIYS